MADREPDVIERMAAAAHNNSASFRAWSHLDAESRACCCDDMLAAVRELQKVADVKFGDDCLVADDMTRAEASIWLRVVIRDHDTKQALRDHERDTADDR